MKAEFEHKSPNIFSRAMQLRDYLATIYPIDGGELAYPLSDRYPV